MQTELNNVVLNGAAGDGVTDDSAAFQNALGLGNINLFIPKGEYRIVSTIKVHSHTHISAHKDARIFMCSDTPKHRGDFLLSNADTVNGNIDISVIGGTWDGNFGGMYNDKPSDLFCPDGYSGTVLNFVNVNGLYLSDLIIANSTVYNIRMAKIENFTIRNIGFFSKKLAHNQDGLHFGGCVKNGYIENIRALSFGQTNDDLIALNADDSLLRLENYDLVCGDIENLTIKNVWAENCHTAIRMLSIKSAIRNIKIENVYAGCRHYAINMDAARYCRTPLFNENDYPFGIGDIENIEINNMKVFCTLQKPSEALILCESNVKNFRITDFERIVSNDECISTPTFAAKNITNMSIKAIASDKAVKSYKASVKSDEICINEPFSELLLNC